MSWCSASSRPAPAPARVGNRPYFRVHLLPAKASQQGRTPPQLEQTGSKDVTEGHAKGQKAKASGRADTRTDRSSERGTPSIRTEEEPDSGAEGVETPGHPGKKGQGPAPRHLCRMWSSTHSRQRQVRDLRREAQGKQAAVPEEGQAKGCSARNSGLRPDPDFLTTAPAPGQTGTFCLPKGLRAPEDGKRLELPGFGPSGPTV